MEKRHRTSGRTVNGLYCVELNMPLLLRQFLSTPLNPVGLGLLHFVDFILGVLLGELQVCVQHLATGFLPIL